MASLAQVALALTAAESVQDVEKVVRLGGAAVLGASGAGSIATLTAQGDWQVALSPDLDATVRDLFSVLPHDSPLPSARVASSGEALFLPNREAQLAYDPVMAGVFEAIGDTEAWAILPLTVGGGSIGALAMGWAEERHLSDTEIDVLEAFTAQCAQAVQRLQSLEAERATERRFHEFAETFQDAMLTSPPSTESLDIEVRYRPAVDVAQVGGDWYDCFLQDDGATVLIIGDVAGHDVRAAGEMVQMRGVLRALAYDSSPAVGAAAWSPAAVLTHFESASTALVVDHMAAVLLARVEPVDPTRAGCRRVRWSNAGGPPPVLVSSDGATQVLEHHGDLMLGVLPDSARSDHVVELSAGATLLMYTDGLVERRRASIDDGINALCSALGDLGTSPVSELCDEVLRRLAPLTGEDDIAMLAVRFEPDERADVGAEAPEQPSVPAPSTSHRRGDSRSSSA